MPSRSLFISFLFALCCIATVIAAPREKPCGGSLSGLFGQIHSPNFPERYPDNLKCNWSISVPDGFYISLNFTEFDTENYDDCSYDYVLVKVNNSLLGKYCGKDKKLYSNVPERPLELRSNLANIEFVTDHSNEELFRGFEAHYAAQDVNECSKDNGGCMHFCHNYIGGYYCTCRIGYKLAKDKKNCIVQCKGNVLSAKTGIIQSPEYPNLYPPFADCEWNIAVERGYSIVLDFEDFSVEEHPDYECPYDWLRVEFANGTFRALCGDKKPNAIVSNTNWIHISFHSDMDENRKGFRIRYYLDSVKCPRLQAPQNGYLAGPTTFHFKDTVSFSCAPGYELVGTRTLACTADGRWTAKTPVCQIKSCGAPKVPFGGFVSGKSFTYGSIVRYTCDVLYNLLGNDTSVCLANATWSGRLPRCKPICGRTKFPSKRMNNCRGRVVGGKEASKGSQPWIAAIYRDGKFVCGGSMINDEWVLTAAHCVTKPNLAVFDRASFKLVLGIHDLAVNDSSVQTHLASEVIKHPEFKYSTYNADVALIRLARRAKITDFVRPVCLPSVKSERQLFKQNRLAMVAGWGKTSSRSRADKLQELCIPLAKRSDCEAVFKNEGYTITNLMFCAGKRGSNRNVCRGDSGGPLVAFNDVSKNWILGGVVSWGSPSRCGSNYEVFARVTKLIGWIKNTALFDINNPFNFDESDY